MVMGNSIKFQKLCRKGRIYVLLVGMVVATYLMLQSLMLPYGTALKSLVPEKEVIPSVRRGFGPSHLSVKSEEESESNFSNVDVVVNQVGVGDSGVSSRRNVGLDETDRNVVDFVASEGKGDDEGLGIAKNGEISSSNLVEVVKENDQSDGGVRRESDVSLEDLDRRMEDVVAAEGKGQDEAFMFVRGNISNDEDNTSVAQFVESSENSSLKADVSSSSDGNENVEGRNRANIILPEIVEKLPKNESIVLRNDNVGMGARRKKKIRPGMPPITVVPIDQMNRRLARHLASSIKMKPQWSSLHDRDKELLEAKSKIIKSAPSIIDKELYAPIFRNVSTFMRSYELMEQTLRVYVYKDGKKPIFHQPILKGLYASEGWFMKLMEANKQFVVKNPEKAHLFYMPFSSRMMEYALYVPNSHNRTSLRQFVKNYQETIAANYPFWNRSGGTDHFLVACHDWALYETRHHMENSIKALCNADVTIGFKIGRDVSLPETFVRYARNPLRDRGGKPPSERKIFAFYAGNSHGYLRPTLLKHWNKDPDMRIYGLLPASVSRKMNYIQHMKSSKYCLCPKGFEVNSPRVVEAIFFECVPVIISDNFVPPLFEVLNWEAFSVIIPEKDIPNLKEILMSIPEEKYLSMQLAVRKVQQHFLWHARPVKYDLFHMTLHSIWFSRVFQIPKR